MTVLNRADVWLLSLSAGGKWHVGPRSSVLRRSVSETLRQRHPGCFDATHWLVIEHLQHYAIAHCVYDHVLLFWLGIVDFKPSNAPCLLTSIQARCFRVSLQDTLYRRQRGIYFPSHYVSQHSTLKRYHTKPRWGREIIVPIGFFYKPELSWLS